MNKEELIAKVQGVFNEQDNEKRFNGGMGLVNEMEKLHNEREAFKLKAEELEAKEKTQALYISNLEKKIMTVGFEETPSHEKEKETVKPSIGDIVSQLTKK